MLRYLVIAAVAVLSCAQPILLKAPYSPYPSTQLYVQPAAVNYVAAPIVLKKASKPYSFGYIAPATGGGSSRQETSDGNGRVTGSYTVSDADGRLRVVDYYADETGFHANVKTNEPGTANQDSADVTVQSFAPPPPKVVVAPPKYIAPVRIVAPAPPVYGYAPTLRRIVTPVRAAYRVQPTYNSLAYSPVPYDSYSSYYGPPKSLYYK